MATDTKTHANVSIIATFLKSYRLYYFADDSELSPPLTPDLRTEMVSARVRKSLANSVKKYYDTLLHHLKRDHQVFLFFPSCRLLFNAVQDSLSFPTLSA